MKEVKESELILNPDGSIYHLKLLPEDIADTIIVVGDQNRVEAISKHFSQIDCKKSNREFVTHTGIFNGKRVTALSTGIGTDNIDIVVNELDALVNFDLKARTINKTHKSLNIIRLGTSGALQPGVDVDTFVVSEYGLGLDGLLNFYDAEHIYEKEMSEAFIKHTGWSDKLPYPYIVKASESLIRRIGEGLKTGITATAPGFYGPQGRVLRLPLADKGINRKIEKFRYKGNRINNFEMETSALLGLCKMLGHNAVTVCDIIANRVTKSFSKDYKKSVEELIRLVLERISS